MGKRLCEKLASELTEDELTRRRKSKRESQMRRYRLAREIVDAFLSEPCADCGKSYSPEIMHADHVRGEKTFTISRKLTSRSYEAIEAELVKCDPRCPTCHALRHHEARQALRAVS